MATIQVNCAVSIFDEEAGWSSVLLLHVHSFAQVAWSKSLQEASGPLSVLDSVTPEVYDRTSGQGTDFYYIAYALFDMLHDIIRNISLCELGTNWNEAEKSQLLSLMTLSKWCL